MKSEKLIPLYTNVVIKFYDENPYTSHEVTSNGLVLGFGGNKRYKSNETGEMEDSEEYIACGKVIAVGEACKYLQEGDDIIAVKHFATPLPYRGKEYFVLNEGNIICKISENG